MKNLWIILMLHLLVACNTGQEASYSVIPLPEEISQLDAAPFKLDGKVSVLYPSDNTLLKRNAEFLSLYVKESMGILPTVTPFDDTVSGTKAVILALDSSIKHKEGYRITITEQNIRIEGQTEAGVFYGIQTLRKAIPVQPEGTVLLPAAVINDHPRFSYRGMHLDVARHFFPVDFVKKYIDLLALHNMNTFHWHLTDDQGWRIEINKYPKLTEVGSVRHRTVVGYMESGKYDTITCGGYYTQAELKEVVRYARERYIDVIPEVDLPGHMLAALAAYPEFGCTGGPYEVSPDWGVFEDVLCVGNEQTMRFLEDVMGELLEIFPSRYIHIGGDEAPRTRWKQCPKCQDRIKTEGLKGDEKYSAEDRLQSYCMKRIERFLNERGRQIIGWDELLEGDIAPNATVMSWRGSAGGIKAARMGHDVIMAPNSHCYFDFYQSADTGNEPLAIGGYIPLEKVYGLEPTQELTEAQSERVLGVQANLWTEYIAATEHVEYMVLPRMAALAEVQWTQPERKDYDSFTSRLTNLLALYRQKGLNYARHIYDIKAEVLPDTLKKTLVVTMNTVDNAPIYYTLDGSKPSKKSLQYVSPVPVHHSARLHAVAVRPDDDSKSFEKEFWFNKATLASITLSTQPAPNYTYKGAITLVDGMMGNENFSTGAWLGFIGENPTAVIDLGKPADIRQVVVNSMTYMDAWIMGITGLEVFVSGDNKDYVRVAKREYPVETDIKKRNIEKYIADFQLTKARYVKIVIRGNSVLPQGHAGEGKMPYLFIDEIQIE